MLKKIPAKFYKLYIKLLLRFSGQYSVADIYRKHFGVKIGKNVRFTGHPAWGSEPYLIEIGNNVTITQNVVFHTHDGGVALFRKEHPGFNVFGKIIIGNNVFVGSNTIFLPGVEIGDNVVIGAGSVVSKNIPSNTVAVGVPARPIKSLEEYKIAALKKATFVVEKNARKRKEIILNTLRNT